MELSHFFGSLVGVALLLLARGLQQRLDAAWMLTSVLLFVGMMLSLLKGGDYEEASILGGMFLALLACRPYFSRKTPLSSRTFSWSWILAIFTILGSTNRNVFIMYGVEGRSWIEVPGLGPGDSRMAILYSSDGGWAGIEKEISLAPTSSPP